MSESDPAPTPSSAPAAGSSSSGPTSTARRSPKIARSARNAAVSMMSVVVLLWGAALMIPNGFLYGGASGASAVMLAYIALFIAKRRGHDTFIVRELEKREDERDRAASRRAWALAGVVGFFGNVVVGAVGAFGGPTTPAIAIILWLQLISLIGGNIYFNRTM